ASEDCTVRMESRRQTANAQNRTECRKACRLCPGPRWHDHRTHGTAEIRFVHRFRRLTQISTASGFLGSFLFESAQYAVKLRLASQASEPSRAALRAGLPHSSESLRVRRFCKRRRLS